MILDLYKRRSGTMRKSCPNQYFPVDWGRGLELEPQLYIGDVRRRESRPNRYRALYLLGIYNINRVLYGSCPLMVSPVSLRTPVRILINQLNGLRAPLLLRSYINLSPKGSGFAR